MFNRISPMGYSAIFCISGFMLLGIEGYLGRLSIIGITLFSIGMIFGFYGYGKNRDHSIYDHYESENK